MEASGDDVLNAADQSNNENQDLQINSHQQQQQ
jgi:hypothetical protein